MTSTSQRTTGYSDDRGRTVRVNSSAVYESAGEPHAIGRADGQALDVHYPAPSHNLPSGKARKCAKCSRQVPELDLDRVTRSTRLST